MDQRPLSDQQQMQANAVAEAFLRDTAREQQRKLEMLEGMYAAAHHDLVSFLTFLDPDFIDICVKNGQPFHLLDDRLVQQRVIAAIKKLKERMAVLESGQKSSSEAGNTEYNPLALACDQLQQLLDQYQQEIQALKQENAQLRLQESTTAQVAQKVQDEERQIEGTEIFAPLDMMHSAAAITDPAVKDITSRYRYWLFWPFAFDAPYPRQMTPAGFLISSAEDMSHYLIAQLNGGTYSKQQALPPDGIDTLHTPGPTSLYTMGWEVRGQPGARIIDHAGDTSNFHSNMLLLPDQQIGIVILINVNGYSHISEVNIPIEGVAEILLGHNLSAALDPPANWVAPAIPLVPFFILIIWIAGSYLFLKSWRRRENLPPRGIQWFWRYFLPLVIDLGLALAAWILIPRQFLTPMETIRLFTPDIFLIIVLMTILAAGWAVTRTYLTFRRSKGKPRGNISSHNAD